MYGWRRSLAFARSCTDVFDVVNLHLLTLKVCGELFVDRNRNTGQLYISWKSFACFVAQLVCLVVLVVGGYYAQQMYSEKDATYLHQATSLLIRLTGVFAIAISISNAIVGKKIWAILECLDKFDKRMIMLNAPVDHRTQKLMIIGWTALFFFGVTSFGAGFIFAVFTSFTNTVLKVVTVAQSIIFVVVMLSMLCQMILVMYLTSFRYYHLRRFFEVHFLPLKTTFFMASELATVNQFRRLTDSGLFCTVIDTYLVLRENMRLIHRTYSVHLLSMTVSIIPTPTLAMFATYRSFMTSNYEMQNLIVIMSLSSIMYTMSYFLLIMLSALNKRETSQLVKSFHHFTNLYHVEFERMVKISADRMHDGSDTLHVGPKEMNWQFAFSMVGTMISYLVILIQFDRSGVGVFILQHTFSNETAIS